MKKLFAITIIGSRGFSFAAKQLPHVVFDLAKNTHYHLVG